MISLIFHLCQGNSFIKRKSPLLVDFAKKYFDMSKVAITVIHPQNTNSQTINENYAKTNAVSFGKSIHKEAIDATKLKQYELPNNMQVTTQTIDKDLVALDMVLKTEAPADIKPGVAEILSIILIIMKFQILLLLLI